MKRIGSIILVLMFVAIGCKMPSFLRDMTSGGTSKGSTPQTSEPRDSDPREDVVAASNKFVSLPFFTANMEGVGEAEIKSQVSYAAPDRYRIKYVAGTAAGTEMILVGNEMYMKSGARWTKLPTSATAIPTLRDSFTEEGLKTLTDVKYEGEDSVDGKEADVYSYNNVTPVDNHPFTTKMWVGKETGLPIKLYVEYSNGTLKNMTITYDTDTPVKIEPPKK